MQDEPNFKGEVAEPGPDDLLTIADIMALCGSTRAAVRQWRLAPASEVPYGKGRVIRLYRRADVMEYATSQRRLNRLPKPKD